MRRLSILSESYHLYHSTINMSTLKCKFLTFICTLGFATMSKGQCDIQNLQATPVSSSQLRISWDCTDDDAEFQVTYQLTNRDQCDSRDDREDSPFDLKTAPWSSANPQDLSDLHPHSTYWVTVQSRSHVGTGEQHEGVEATTDESVPTNTPLNIEVSTVSLYMIRFTWSEPPCGQRHGDIKYTYRIMDADDATQDTQEGSNTLPEVTVFNRSPCTTYMFSVAAKTSAGTGPFSNAVSATTDPVVPGRVANLNKQEGPTQVIVTWEAPIGPCDIISYRIEYRLIKEDQCRFVEGNIEVVNFEATEVTLSGLTPHSTYNMSVTAYNGVWGMTASETILTADVVPTRVPLNVQASRVTTEGMRFSWEMVQCGYRGGELNYLYRLMNDRGHVLTSGEAYDLSVDFDRLVPCSMYSFLVAANNTAGAGDFSSPVSATTHTLAPEAVSNLQVFPTTSSCTEKCELRVSWQAPSGTCPASQYAIYYRLSDRGQCSQQPGAGLQSGGITTGTEMTIGQAQRLYAYSTYTIYVTASNSAGSGVQVEVDGTTPESAPNGKPRNVRVSIVTSDVIQFSWDEPLCEMRNGLITKYHYNLTSQYSSTNGDVMGTTTVFDKLIPYVNYEFSVAAVNDVGNGPFSDVLTQRTPEDIPPQPDNLILQNADFESLMVQWRPPDPPHGLIISYDIDYGENATFSDESTNILIEDILATEYRIGNLTRETSYVIRVRAETRIGKGPWSPVISGITKEGLPGPPRQFQVTGKNQTSMTLTWEPPSTQNGKITGYMVQYKIIKKPYDAMFETVEVTSLEPIPSNARKIVISGLEPSTGYLIDISASTALGFGNITTVINFTQPAIITNPPAKANRLEVTDSTVTIKMPQPTLEYIRSYLVHVSQVSTKQKSNKRDAYNRDFSGYSQNSTDYIAGEIERNEDRFTVGDNMTYGMYYNAPLQKGMTYEISVAYVTCIDDTLESECVSWSGPINVTVKKDTDHPIITFFQERPVAILVSALALLSTLVIVILLGCIICICSAWSQNKENNVEDPSGNTGTRPWHKYYSIKGTPGQQNTTDTEPDYEVTLGTQENPRMPPGIYEDNMELYSREVTRMPNPLYVGHDNSGYRGTSHASTANESPTDNDYDLPPDAEYRSEAPRMPRRPVHRQTEQNATNSGKQYDKLQGKPLAESAVTSREGRMTEPSHYSCSGYVNQESINKANVERSRKKQEHRPLSENTTLQKNFLAAMKTHLNPSNAESKC